VFTKLTKWFSITALVLGLFSGSSAGFRIGMEMVVCVAALAVLTQACRTGESIWGGAGLSPLRCYLIPPRP
jgi:hypothetical protein